MECYITDSYPVTIGMVRKLVAKRFLASLCGGDREVAVHLQHPVHNEPIKLRGPADFTEVSTYLAHSLEPSVGRPMGITQCQKLMLTEVTGYSQIAKWPLALRGFRAALAGPMRFLMGRMDQIEFTQ